MISEKFAAVICDDYTDLGLLNAVCGIQFSKITSHTYVLSVLFMYNY